MTLTIVTCLVMLTLGYGLALIRHDTNRHEWLLAWLIGHNRQHATLLRQVAEQLGLPPPPNPEPPEEPTWWQRITAALAHLHLRRPPDAEPEPRQPPEPADEDPPTEPIAEVLADHLHPPIDDEPWRARFTFNDTGREGHR